MYVRFGEFFVLGGREFGELSDWVRVTDRRRPRYGKTANDRFLFHHLDNWSPFDICECKSIR